MLNVVWAVWERIKIDQFKILLKRRIAELKQSEIGWHLCFCDKLIFPFSFPSAATNGKQKQKQATKQKL